jgi:DNA-binding response OmpR family regulator
MVGPVPAREEDTARHTGARGDFVSGLGMRVEALRVSLRAIEQDPSDTAQRNALLRRVHALSSASRVLGFASVAEALTEVERRLRRSDFGEVARSLDLLPSLVLGMPVSLRQHPDVAGDRAGSTWPLSVLIFGAQSLADAIQAIPGTYVECERTEDLGRAREQARLFGPDLAIIDADRAGARELVETFARDPAVEPVPLVVIGDFANPEAASAFIALGAARVLNKPVSPEALQRTVVELRAQAAEPRPARDPLGDLSVEALAERISGEVRRGLLEAVEPSSRGMSVDFGDGADVMAAVWGAVARVRELVTLRSSGAVRFDSSGPEGAVPIAAWSNDERRAGERGTGSSDPRASDDVNLQGRRIVIADDDPAVVWFMSGLLKALGVEVLEAHDGSRALALTYDSWPDLVVSDVLMPKLDGFSLCHEIKRDVAVRDVPVILLSWKEDLLQRVRELGASADGYLRKEAAASTVAERLREVLRPRARVERRIAAGGDARGRLDGLTPRLILELASAGQRDVRVGIRDAVYLYEVQIRRGRLCSATRSSSAGSFERGEFVLAALLGVSAGRFVIEPDASPCRADFDGTPAEILKGPIERARASLNSISAEALVGVTRVQIAAPVIEGYLACTPEPARGLLQKVMAGASPRELITSGSVAPRLLEAVLSDVARRGAITDIERLGGEPSPLRGSAPPPAQAPLSPSAPKILLAPPIAPKVSEPVSEADAGWFSLQVESGTPAPVGEQLELAPISVAAVPARRVEAPKPEQSKPAPPPADKTKTLPFSSEVTPSVDRLWDTLTEGVFNDNTLQGVGAVLPAVAAAKVPLESAAAVVGPEALHSRPEPSPAGNAVAAKLQSPAPAPARPAPSPAPSRANELDALANALTGDSPSPPAAIPVGATQVMTALALPVAPAQRAEPVPPVETVAGSLAGAPHAESPAEPSRPTPTSEGGAEAAPLAAKRSSALKSELRSAAPTSKASSAPVAKPKPASGSGAWFVTALLAFAVSYAIVSYFRASPPHPAGDAPPGPLPASSR